MEFTLDKLICTAISSQATNIHPSYKHNPLLYIIMIIVHIVYRQ
jgi:hypothetical protein